MDSADHGVRGQCTVSTMDREQMGRLFPDHSNGPDASTAPIKWIGSQTGNTQPLLPLIQSL
jgi:hypothetical protein